MARWVSDKSLHIYARDNRHDYGDWLSKALTANVSSVSTANLPEMDNDAAFALLADIYGPSGGGEWGMGMKGACLLLHLGKALVPPMKWGY